MRSPLVYKTRYILLLMCGARPDDDVDTIIYSYFYIAISPAYAINQFSFIFFLRPNDFPVKHTMCNF